MSISVSKIVNLPQAASKFLVEDETENELRREFATLGGVFSDTDYAWLSKGPRLQVIHTKTGTKVGAWSFGWVLKDSNTQIVCVDEIQRPHGRSPLLAVGLDCDFSGGMVCIFDFVTSKVIRAIQVKDRISTLHVIDSGYDVFTLPSPLRSFDGIIAVGTAGGDVFLIDICRQICDEALTTSGLNEIRDELNPCQLSNITSKDILKIEIHKEYAVRNCQHLAIHLNVVFDKSTKHFTLKGPKGDDRIHVNKDEVTVSALYYCPQLGSLLVGYNFGALQLYNLMNLELVYTSPVCDEHIPISHFAVQEPVDDPRAFCYVWAVYSGSEQFSTCLPLAVMYAFSYGTKEYHEGYGFLYQDFNTAAVHYQMELGIPEGDKRVAKHRGGYCLKLNSINHSPKNRDGPNESNEDNLTLCVLVWNVRFTNKETDTFVALFDLNQWYKEQMPNLPSNQFSSTYMIQLVVSNLISSATNKSTSVLDVHINKNSLQQFRGAQRLEEHFCPNSISFGMCCLRETDVVHLQNYGVQKALLAQIEMSGPMCLVGPAETYQEIVGLGLIPLFIDLPGNTPITTNQQREIILGAALENQLMGWLCKCASEWANGSYLSTGCSLGFLISWAFQRAVTLKYNCDNFCIPLFDYSEVRLDNNTNILLNSCTRQLKDLCSLYAFMIRKLYMFISNQELADEQYKSLQMGSVYFEVLQWLLNVGLLPECPLTAYPRSDDLDRINAPYPAELLTDFYNHRRAILKILNEENFASTSSVLFIDTLIENECGGNTLQEQWRNDGGNGLYPPPSLQALLRTYLIDNVELAYKHSVTIYVFLDLAMTLDQEKYKPVITQLIKFPAVFKVSPSVIKITQAFWQLDHGDYNTAMGLLLDPLISREDLNQWHHQVALRSLLLQKQYNFALLYVQVRKPTFVDDDDIKTAISLYVANNMLDEAFYFENHFTKDPRGDKFLLHLFNECKKNDKLRSIIYRTLSAADERIFLKYLLESKDPVAEDLHVYYHILRSHYIEAFESHERTVPNKIENQGLMGQEDAIPRDKLVHSLKRLLPDIKRNVLNFCHKEKNNVWTPATRPTPMSVFVYNHRENVQYKSTLIGAALAKAKQLFSDTVNTKFRLETEVTPFLRTPKAVINSGKVSAVIVNSEVIDNRKLDEGVRPPKRLKLSPRRGNASFSASIPAKLDTPVVKRKTPKSYTTPEEKYEATTPHSILKVRSLANHVASKDDGQFKDDFKAFEKLEYTPVTSKKAGLGLSPRKSLAKTPPVVRFEGLMSSSSSSLNNTSRSLSALIEKSDPSNQTNSIEKNTSSKNTSAEDEVFYSPDTSFEDKNESVEVKPIDLNEESVNEVKDKEEETAEERSTSPVFSPRSRRSYKRSLGAMSPTRSSPRLSKLNPIPSPQQVEIEEPLPSVKEDSNKEPLSSQNQNDNFLSSPSPLPKLRPRKSLCRQVLETNALSRVLNSPVETPRNSRSRKVESTVTRTEETVEKLEENIKYDDGEETYTATAITKHNLTTSIVESDLDVSEDYSINYEIADEPEEPIVLNKIEETESTKKITSEESEEALNNKKIGHDETFQKNIFSRNNALVDEITKSFEIADDNLDSNETGRMTEEIHQHHENSANNCFKEPKLLESSIVANVSGADIETVQNDEAMDIDHEEKHVEVISISDTTLEIIEEKIPLENEPSETKEDDDKDEPTNRPVDPEMNVFEISDDLSVNDGLEIQKEVHVALEENDLCYDQQNTLESVLEENISVTSTPLKAFEKNVFSEDLSDSDDSEELNQKSGSDEEILPRKSDGDDQDSEYSMEKEGDDDESEKSEEFRRKTPPKIDENEIIEIGSSSEDEEEKHQEESSEYEEKNQEESSEYDTDRSSQYYESEDEKPEVQYERRIYDSEDNSLSKSSYERHHSEISENSDDFKDDSRHCALFHGDILLAADEQKKNAEQSMSSEDEDHSRESQEDANEKTDAVEEDAANIYEDLDEPVEDSREKIQEAKLFDADQFVTVVDEDIEEHLDDNNDTKENLENTSMECGLFHGGILDSSNSEEAEEVLLNKEEGKPSETLDDAVGGKLSTIEEEQEAVNNVEVENKTTVVSLEEKPEILTMEEEEIDVQAQVQDIPFEKEKEATLQSEQRDETIPTKGQEVTLSVAQKHIFSLEEEQQEMTNESEVRLQENLIMRDPLDSTTLFEDYKKCKESGTKMFGNNRISEMDQKSESKAKTTCRDPLDATVIQPSTSAFRPDPVDTFGLDPNKEDTSSDSISRKLRSKSVSTKGGKEKNKESDVKDEIMDQKSESKAKTTSRDPLDATIIQPSTSALNPDPVVTFGLDTNKKDTSSNSISRKMRSRSVSTKGGMKKRKDSDVSDEGMDQKGESKAKTTCRDPLDATIIQPSTSALNPDPVDTFGLNPNKEDTSSNSRSRKIKSSSVSTKGGKKIDKDSDVRDEAPLSRKNSGVDDKLEVEAEKIHVPKRNLRPRRASADQPTDLPAKKLRQRRASADEPAPIRKLRPRRASADEPTSSTALRQRSSSVDEMPPSEVKSFKTDTTNSRKKRATSVAALPKIVEEDDGDKTATTHKKAKSLLEGYSATRRVTRQQKSLLMRVETGAEGKKLDLEFLDPIVFLDKLPFEGKPDPDEKKIYEKSPSSTSSPSTSPQKQSRGLRSASQASDRSQRSKSTTPVRSVRRRLKSTDEEEAVPSVTTRSRARSASVSTVNSDDSNIQETVKLGKRRQRLASQTALPDIQEEINKSETVVPKKRLRRGSSQK